MKFFKAHPKLRIVIPVILVVLVAAGGIWALYSTQLRLKLTHGWGCTQIAEITFEEESSTFLVSQAGESLYVDTLTKNNMGIPQLGIPSISSQGWSFGSGVSMETPQDADTQFTNLSVLVRWVDAPGTEQTFPVEEPVEIQVRYYSIGDRTLEAVLFRTENSDYSGSQWQIDKANELLGKAS